MACHVPFNDVARAIHCLQEDGGVILTGFATPEEVTRVNEDAAPYLEAAAKEVPSPYVGPRSLSLTLAASLERADRGNPTVPQTFWTQPDSSREMVATTTGPPDSQLFPENYLNTI